MRGAMRAESFDLSPDELAGLACEEEFESRLVIDTPAGWQVKHGPFDDAGFARLPASGWTLLVQDVDKYLPSVASLIDGFDFVPGWRIDDIMISYAVDGGGVGPHTDAYDVFLMQAQGRRRWRISYTDYTDADLIPGIEQRILSHFEVDEDWLLEPGDVLYLPPGVAHWGTAEGDCMTWSLGFRSPSQKELAADWFQYLVAAAGGQRLNDPDNLADSDRTAPDASAIEQASRLLAQLPDTRSAEFAAWLGRYFTEPKPQFQIKAPDTPWDNATLDARLAGRAALLRHPFARITWLKPDTGGLLLFFQGEEIAIDARCQSLASLIAGKRTLPADALAACLSGCPGGREVLLELLNRGILEDEVGEP